MLALVKWKLRYDGGERGKDRGLPKSLGIIVRATAIYNMVLYINAQIHGELLRYLALDQSVVWTDHVKY